MNLSLSPSLLKFSLTVEPSGNESSYLVESKRLRPRLAGLLRSLPQQCPNLEEIHIPTIRNSYSLQAAAHYDLYESLASLPHLRIVSGSEMLLEPQNLTLLGALPYLESLAIHSRNHPVATLTPDWPMDYFAALRRLQLHDLRLEAIFSILKIRTLVHQLTSLDIQGYPDLTDQRPSYLFYDICTQCMHITTLSISFSAFVTYKFKLSSQELNLLRQLPLQSICLQDVRLGSEITHLDFILAVPEARILRLPSQPVILQDLRFYAMHLPNLEILCLRLAVDPKSPQREESLVSVTRKVVFEITQSSGLNGRAPIVARLVTSVFIQYIYMLMP